MSHTDNARHPLLSLVAETVEPGESFLVALSGGADSVALLAALHELGHRCHALHCNYHLRGDESDRDEQHARAVSMQLGIPCDVVHCDVRRYRSEHRRESVEMACRAMRYRAFAQSRERLSLDSIAIGHHLEDNIETLMINLLRGSGIKGLAGMRQRRGPHVRPLLQCTKEMILDYLQSRGLTYVTDSTNLGNDFRRNVLRNEILPLVYRYFPTAPAGLRRTISSLDNQRRLLDDTIQSARNDYVDNEGNIDLSAIIAREPHPDVLLFELLNTPDYRGYNIDIVNDIISSSKRSGLRFRADIDTAGYILDHGRLIVPENIPTHSKSVSTRADQLENLRPAIEVSYIDRAEFNPSRDPSTAYFDADRLEDYGTLTLREPRRGDRLQPWGMKGSRLVSDILSDRHATLSDKRSCRLLTAGDDGPILWVVGIRASRHAMVTPRTRRIAVLHAKRLSHNT